MNKVKLISYILILVVILASLLFYVYFYTSLLTFKKSPQPITNNEVITKTSPGNIGETSQTAINSYVTNINSELEKLDPESPEARLLLVRKAAALSLPRDVAFERLNLLETLDIFSKIVFAKDSPDDMAKKNAIVALARMYDQWCFDSRGISPLTYKIPQLSESYKIHLKNYDNSQINTMLTISNFLSSFKKDEVLSKDTIFLVTKGKIEAVALRSFYKDLRLEDRNYLLKELKYDLESLKTSEYLTFMPDKNGLSDKQMQYAILNDVYESYSADTKEKINNLKIDIEYEKLFTEMRQYQGKDRMSVDMFRSIGIIYYSDSLLRRYGEAKSKYVNDVLLQDFLNIMDAKPVIKELMAAYFRDGLYGGSKWEVMKNNFIYLANTNPRLMKYLTSTGIKEEEIKAKTNDWKTWPN
jgi:hypothetical protein